MRRLFVFFALFMSSAFFVVGQDILTADRFLASVGDRYALIKDYQAKIVIRSANTEMRGSLIHKNPNLLRIDFSQPEEQVIVFNGDTLTVYLPEYRAVLSQTVVSDKKASGANLATAQGLAILRRAYAAAYLSGPDPVALDANGPDLVVKLALTRRNLSEGFRELTLSVSPETLLIRRIEGRTIADESLRFDFTEIKVDQGIPEARFAYDSPASANLYNNFLFKETD
ncbi:outer-membrane lipoprotein carrier protein LolA [Treponema sp.]